MKKILVILLIALLVLSTSACGELVEEARFTVKDVSVGENCLLTTNEGRFFIILDRDVNKFMLNRSYYMKYRTRTWGWTDIIELYEIDDV